MSDTWVAVAVVGAMTIAFKAAGPVFLRGRPLPKRMEDMIELLAPVLLAALVVTQVFAGDRRIEFDERTIGIAAALVPLLMRAHIVVVAGVAAAATAVARAL